MKIIFTVKDGEVFPNVQYVGDSTICKQYVGDSTICKQYVGDSSGSKLRSLRLLIQTSTIKELGSCFQVFSNNNHMVTKPPI